MGMVPRKILRFSFAIMHIWRILRENLRKYEPKLTMKTACGIYRYPKCVAIRLNVAVAICRYFPNGRCRLDIVYTAFDFKMFTFS